MSVYCFIGRASRERSEKAISGWFCVAPHTSRIVVTSAIASIAFPWEDDEKVERFSFKELHDGATRRPPGAARPGITRGYVVASTLRPAAILSYNVRGSLASGARVRHRLLWRAPTIAETRRAERKASRNQLTLATFLERAASRNFR